jgi:DNA-binding transcriptional MerR regulator
VAHLFRIGEFAERTGKTKRALHLYEEKGLMAPASRSSGGYRLYDEDNVRRIAFIDKMQLLGLSLTDVKNLLDSWNVSATAPDTMAMVAREYRSQLTEVRAKLSALQALEREFEASLEFLEGCRSCDDHSTTGTDACSRCTRQIEESSGLTLISGVTAH